MQRDGGHESDSRMQFGVPFMTHVSGPSLAQGHRPIRAWTGTSGWARSLNPTDRFPSTCSPGIIVFFISKLPMRFGQRERVSGCSTLQPHFSSHRCGVNPSTGGGKVVSITVGIALAVAVSAYSGGGALSTNKFKVGSGLIIGSTTSKKWSFSHSYILAVSWM
jgi:hypothetical protein